MQRKDHKRKKGVIIPTTEAFTSTRCSSRILITGNAQVEIPATKINTIEGEITFFNAVGCFPNIKSDTWEKRRKQDTNSMQGKLDPQLHKIKQTTKYASAFTKFS